MKRSTMTFVMVFDREVTPAEQAELETAMSVQAEDIGYHSAEMNFYESEEGQGKVKMNALMDALEDELSDLAMFAEMHYEESNKEDISAFVDMKNIEGLIDQLKNYKRLLNQ